MRGVKWGVGVGAWAFGEGTKKKGGARGRRGGPLKPIPPSP